jgi:hypothetical protein
MPNSRTFLPSFSSFTVRCLLATAVELWWVNQEWLELIGKHNRSVKIAVSGTPYAIPPRKQ